MSDEWQDVAKEFGHGMWTTKFLEGPAAGLYSTSNETIRRMAEEILACRKERDAMANLVGLMMSGIQHIAPGGTTETCGLCFSALEDWRIYSEKLWKALDEASQELWIQGVPRSIREALDLPRPGDHEL